MKVHLKQWLRINLGMFNFVFPLSTSSTHVFDIKRIVFLEPKINVIKGLTSNWLWLIQLGSYQDSSKLKELSLRSKLCTYIEQLKNIINFRSGWTEVISSIAGPKSILSQLYWSRNPFGTFRQFLLDYGLMDTCSISFCDKQFRDLFSWRIVSPVGFHD